MNEINRGAIVIKPKPPFVEWVNSTGDALTREEVCRDSTVYLTPEIEDDRELFEFLKENYNQIFEQELIAWIQDEDLWPASRDFPIFQNWFDVEFHSLVLDLSEEEIMVVDEVI